LAVLDPSAVRDPDCAADGDHPLRVGREAHCSSERERAALEEAVAVDRRDELLR
jgi:hypothetical protein